MSKKTIIAPESKKNTYTQLSSEESEKSSSPGEDQNSYAHQMALKRCEDRKKFVTFSDQIAEHTFYFRNYKYQRANILYPRDLDSDYRFVSKCYPYAKCGMLLVDEPKNEHEYQMALKKQEALRKSGFKHIVIWLESKDPKQQKDPEEIFYDCHEQLKLGEEMYVAHCKAGSKN